MNTFHLDEGTQFSEDEGEDGPRHKSRNFSSILVKCRERWAAEVGRPCCFYLAINNFGRRQQLTFLRFHVRSISFPFLTYFVYLRIQTAQTVFRLYHLILHHFFSINSEDKSKSVLKDLGCKRRISYSPQKGLVGGFSQIGDQFKSQ